MQRRKMIGGREISELKGLIEEKTGYNIRQSYLLNQAFTRSSFSAEQGGENNEILEFIGDQVLNYFVVVFLCCFFLFLYKVWFHFELLWR